MSFPYHVHSSYSHTHMYHIGLQEETSLVELEDPEGGITQEVLGDKEQDMELSECPDHQPSSFEKGKSQSISLPMVCK
jgi:hypothetical protein